MAEDGEMNRAEREQRDAVFFAIKEENERQAAEDAEVAKVKAADRAEAKAISVWNVWANDVFDEGARIFGSDEATLRRLTMVLDNRHEAREHRYQTYLRKKRQQLANLTEFGAWKDALSLGVFMFTPMGVILAIILELFIPSIFAGAIGIAVVIALVYRRYFWLKVEGRRVRAEDFETGNMIEQGSPELK